MLKKLLGVFLKRISDSMVTLAPASLCGNGIEEMPESMKKLR